MAQDKKKSTLTKLSQSKSVKRSVGKTSVICEIFFFIKKLQLSLLLLNFQNDNNNLLIIFNFQIDVIYMDDLIPEDYTLIDVAYYYNWKKDAPMKLVR